MTGNTRFYPHFPGTITRNLHGNAGGDLTYRIATIPCLMVCFVRHHSVPLSRAFAGDYSDDADRRPKTEKW